MAGSRIELGLAPYVREPVGHHPLTAEYVTSLRALLPQGWSLVRDSMWVFASPPQSEPVPATRRITQGFKIHVSVTPDDAIRAMEAIVPQLSRAGIDFKIVGDPALHYLLQSKRYPRGASGKFMTIYPPDDSTFQSLVVKLHRSIQDVSLKGPRILSDRQYGTSGVLFYRYGGFWPPRRVTLDGTHETFLVSPSGQYVPDRRLPYYQLPSWVSDPFKSDKILPDHRHGDQGGSPVILNGQFQIDEALSFSNAGGIYAGVDVTTSEPVVIKEARPYTNYWRAGNLVCDAVSLLAREFMILEMLKGLDFIPSSIAFFESGGHHFLVQQRVDARRIRTYWARDEVIVSPYVRNQARVRFWAQKFKATAEALIHMVLRVHERGVLIGDLSADNVLQNPETGRMWILDFESAVVAADSKEQKLFAAMWATPGFKNPARELREQLLPEDDFYAAGMVLSCALMAVSYFSLNPDALTRFLDNFISLGIPTEVSEVIHALVVGDVSAALDTLSRWHI
jgi:Protein kinase domain